MREVRVYFEGGGDSRDSKEALRKGFRQLFQKAGFSVGVIACGRRGKALKDWKIALSSHPEAFNILLVDAESAVVEGSTPWRHLSASDPSWQAPSVPEEHCHLMVQVMEAWFVADPEALAAYYGQGFAAGSLPARRNVEEIAKADIERSLKTATQKTRKGEYHKIRHASDLLARIDPAKVRERARHCERLLATLAKLSS